MTNEKKNKVTGVLGTILFHIGLLILLLLMALRIPIPQADPGGGGGGGGIAINLGFDDNGMGTDQQDQPAPAALLVHQTASRPQEEPEEYLVQNDEESAVIQAKKPEEIKKKAEKPIPKPKPKPEPEPLKEVIQPVTEPANEAAAPETKPVPQPQANPRAMYKGNSTSSTKGGQEGQTGKPGDQGQPDGIPGAHVYKGISGQGSGTGSGYGTGTGNGNGSGIGSGNGSGTGQGDGSGNGISYSLGKRGSKSLFKPPNDFKAEGKVVVTIKVDKNGNVTSAVAGAKGTNVSDQTLWQLAKDAALKSKFESDADAPDTQVGTITYNFIRQN